MSSSIVLPHYKTIGKKLKLTHAVNTELKGGLEEFRKS